MTRGEIRPRERRSVSWFETHSLSRLILRSPPPILRDGPSGLLRMRQRAWQSAGVSKDERGNMDCRDFRREDGASLLLTGNDNKRGEPQSNRNTATATAQVQRPCASPSAAAVLESESMIRRLCS